MKLPSVGVVIPTIPERAELLNRALLSVERQTYAGPVEVHVAVDHAGMGAAVTRQHAADDALASGCDYLAFLDDDDELLPEHLAVLVDHALVENADVVWPWFTVVGGTDPFPQHRGRQWNPDDPHIFPITALVKAGPFRDVGGFIYQAPMVDPNDPASGRMVSGEDWLLWLALSTAGARFSHVDKVTWTWFHNSSNTSGLARNRRQQ